MRRNCKLKIENCKLKIGPQPAPKAIFNLQFTIFNLQFVGAARSPLRRWSIALASLLGLFCLLLVPRPALAAGTESSRRAHDLQMTVDTRWAGGASGGYYPIRIRLANLARPRALEFVFNDAGLAGSRTPTVSREISIDQNATVQFSLSIPLVSASGYGVLRVFENGRELEQLGQHVNLPDDDQNTIDRPSLLVVSPSPATVDCSRFEAAVQAVFGSVHVASSRMAIYSGGSIARANDFHVINPTLLPESWIDYTALDILAIPLATLEKISTDARNAILKWAQAGGTLVVYEVNTAAERSADLSRLLNLAGRAAQFQSWEAADPAARQRTTTTLEATIKGLDAEGFPTHLAGSPAWPETPEAFSRIDLAAGRVYAFPENPFPGSTIDWAWWLRSAGVKRLDWTARHGMSSREAYWQFNEFLIPGVGTVPMLAFIILISIFAVLIGPVNYFIAWRRKQLYLLVVTIPAIAFVTSAALFGYAAIADGFGVQSRLRSVTLLDQVSKTAVSFNRISLYAGIVPSDGLRFSPETAVYPVWSSSAAFESGSVDWSDAQHLARGWLRSRTRTQFETVSVRAERGRLDLRPADGGGIDASNGLAWTIELVLVKDDDGRIYLGRGIPAGGSTRLAAATTESLRELAEVLGDDSLKAPPGADAINVRRSTRAYGYMIDDEARKSLGFSGSLLETYLGLMQKPAQEPAAGGLAPRTYLATLAENPGIELGVPRTRPSRGLYLVIGYY
jgi:hypothetical protein